MNKKDWPRRRVLLSKISTAVAFSLLMSSAFASTTWYVNPNGSDDASGTDAASAFKTLTFAHQKATAEDTIVLSEGVHEIATAFRPTKKIHYIGAGRDKTILRQTQAQTGASGRVLRLDQAGCAGSVFERLSITGGRTTGKNNHGGGVYMNKDCTIRDCDIYGNKCSPGNDSNGAYGNGVWLNSGTLDGCRIFNNKPDEDQTYSFTGGVNVGGGSPVIKNCLIYGNHANGRAGGVAVTTTATCKIYNCTITGNSVDQSTGNVRDAASGFLSFGNVNFGMMENTIIVGNIDNGKNSKAWAGSRGDSNFSEEFRNCVFDHKAYGIDPITASAEDIFEDFGDLKYTPKFGSVLIDKSYTENYTGEEDIDVYGNIRKSGAAMDIGAVERNLAIDSLFLTATPQEFLCPTPDYGTYLFSQKGEKLSLSVPADSITDEVSRNEYAAAGWRLYFVDPLTTEKTLVDSGDSLSYTYENAGGFHILEWQFLATAFNLDVAVEGTGGAVESGNYSVKRGETVTVKAIPDPGYVLSEWIGDFPEGVDVNENPLTFVPEKSIAITAKFLPVRYVSVAGNDANDGFTPETAWKDVAFAVSNMNCIGRGAILNIGEGTHDVIKELVITNSITVRGSGREKTVLKSTGKNYRVFGIGENKSYKGTTKDITIEKLAITGASSDIDMGLGGLGVLVGANASNVSLLDLDIYDNVVLDENAQAVGVSLCLASAYVRRCRIYNNHSKTDNVSGGGVYIKAGTIESSLIFGNSANCTGGSNRGKCGGGLCIEGPAKIYNCTIVANEETGSGYLGGAGGFYAKDSTFTMVNTVVAGNYCSGSISRFGTTWSSIPSLSLSALSNCFYNCAFDCDPVGEGSVKCDISQFEITDGIKVGALPNFPGINAGTVSAYTLSRTDLDGGQRAADGQVDIGAEEFDPEVKSVAFSPVKSEIFLGESVTYTPVAAGGVASPSYSWSVTNAAGEVVCSATGETFEFSPKAYGSYGVSLTASFGAETMTYEVGGAVLVSSPEIYVSSEADESVALPPFATPETATASLEEALKWAIDGSEVFVKGTNSASINISRAVTVTGEGGRKVDRINARSGRVAVLRHPGALLRGLTLSGGAHYRGPGAYIACGTVENCRVTGNTVKALSRYDCQGSVYVGDADARVSRTIIDNNVVTDNLGCGAGAYACFGSLDNCLISSNRACSGAGVLLANSSAKIINCTVANNIDVGSSTTDYGAGVFVCSPSQQVINSVFYGNMHEGSASDWKTTLAAEDVASVFSNCAFTAFEDGTFLSPSTTCAGVKAFDFINLTSFQPAPRGALHNKGALDYVYSKGAMDLLGRKRVLGRVDIGCYEVQGEGFYIIIR